MPGRQSSQPQSNRSSWYEQNHVDLGALRERVTSSERSLSGLDDKVTTLQRDTAAQISNLQTSLSSQIRDMSQSFNATRTTNWGTIIAAAGFVLILGGAVLAPLMSDLRKASDALDGLTERTVKNEDYRSSLDQQQRRNLAMDAVSSALEKELVKTEVSLARLDGMETERHEEYLRSDMRHEVREDTMDSNIIKRPEIVGIASSLLDKINSVVATLNDRINSVIIGVDQVRHDSASNYTTGDRLKEFEQELTQIRNQASGLPLGTSAPAK